MRVTRPHRRSERHSVAGWKYRNGPVAILSRSIGDRDHALAGAFGIPVAVRHAGPSRLRREASCGRRAREISALAAARRGNRELRFILKAREAPGRGRPAPPREASGPCPLTQRRLVHGRCDADLAPPAVPVAAVPGFSAMAAAPSGLTLKSRDRRRRMPVGTCSKLQPHARHQAALGLTMFGLFAEPSSPHARDRQGEQPTWRHGQVRVGLWPFGATVDLGGH